MGLVIANGDYDCDLDVKSKRDLRRRVSHSEDACPCRDVVRQQRDQRGRGKQLTVVVAGGGGVCENRTVNVDDDESGGRRIRLKGDFGGSLDRKKRGKRLSATSTSSSVSRINDQQEEDGDDQRASGVSWDMCVNGDVNNNHNSCRKSDSNKEGWKKGEGNGDDEEVQNRRNEAREEDDDRLWNRKSVGSVSSFTKDIMRMIDKRTNAGEYFLKSENTKSVVDKESPSEEIERMNRRNSSLSQGVVAVVDRCECPCHSDKGRGQKSPTSPTSVNIYSIEQRGKKAEMSKGCLEKGQLEAATNKSDHGEESEENYRPEYDRDQADEVEFENERQGKRRISGGGGGVL